MIPKNTRFNILNKNTGTIQLYCNNIIPIGLFKAEFKLGEVKSDHEKDDDSHHGTSVRLI
jgi:hypothetical protein